MQGLRFRNTTRRNFLQVAAATAGASALRTAWAEDPPAATHPRATSGDPLEPDWQQRLTVTVGPAKADLVGTNHRALQAAVDYVSRLGGGTVQVLPGEYRLRNAVHLRSGVRLVGAGADTRLIKEPSITTKLAADSDWYDQEITVEDARGLRLGDGICLQATNPHHGGREVLKRTLVAQSGNRFKLDRPLRANFWLMGDATVSTLFPLVTGEEIGDLAIENITLDGNKEHNELLDGNYAGCIFLQDCHNIAIRGVTARNYHGDGISWQICHDVAVDNCHSHDNTGLGLHPGSGSQRPVIRDNKLERNDIGLFFCWGVKYGLAERNSIRANRVGVSIGHRDTDNLIADNTVEGSREVGVLFRAERGRDFAPHRNRLLRNRIVDSGPMDGVAVDIQGQTEAIEVARNELREKRSPGERIGVRIGAETSAIQLADNTIDGFAQPVVDLRQ